MLLSRVKINKPVSMIFILAIAMVVFFLFALPKYQESLDLESEIMKKQAQYESKADYYLKLSDNLGKLDKERDVLAKIESALPDKFALAPITYFLQDKAKATGMNIDSLNFSDPQIYQKKLSNNSGREIKKVSFKVNLTGSYLGMKEFVLALEKSARLFEVNSVSFSSGSLSGLGRAQSISKTYNFALDIQTHTY